MLLTFIFTFKPPYSNLLNDLLKFPRYGVIYMLHDRHFLVFSEDQSILYTTRSGHWHIGSQERSHYAWRVETPTSL